MTNNLYESRHSLPSNRDTIDFKKVVHHALSIANVKNIRGIIDSDELDRKYRNGLVARMLQVQLLGSDYDDDIIITVCCPPCEGLPSYTIQTISPWASESEYWESHDKDEFVNDLVDVINTMRVAGNMKGQEIVCPQAKIIHEKFEKSVKKRLEEFRVSQNTIHGEKELTSTLRDIASVGEIEKEMANGEWTIWKKDSSKYLDLKVNYDSGKYKFTAYDGYHPLGKWVGNSVEELTYDVSEAFEGTETNTIKESVFGLFKSLTATKEAVDKNGKYTQFKRFISDRDKEAGIKKFHVPLNNEARRGHKDDDINEGFFFTGDYDTETGDAEDRTWYEVVDKKHDSDGCIIYLVPVDEFGNKLTASQINKKFPYFTRNMEKYGYCKSMFISKNPEENNFLVVDTQEIDGYTPTGRWCSAGRAIGSYNRSLGEYMFDYDENGNIVPNERWKAAHPDLEFDPDFDDTYSARNDHVDQFNGRRISSFGKWEDRHDWENAMKAKRDAADKVRARSFIDKRMHSPWGGFTSEFDKANPGFKDFDKADKEFFEKEFSGQTYPGENRGSMSPREFKKWCIDKGLDWNSVKRAMQNARGDFAEAYVNANYR